MIPAVLLDEISTILYNAGFLLMQSQEDKTRFIIRPFSNGASVDAEAQ